MRHDPPRDAAAYLGGAMSDRKIEQFEAHLLACADCWREVTQARSGRAIGESLRELAPQSLREDIRAATQSESPSPRRLQLRWLTAAAMAVALVAIAGTALLRPGQGDRSVAQQPESIAQAIIDFQNGRIPAERPVEHDAPDLAGLGFTVSGAGSGQVGDVEVDGFSYQDKAGRRLQLYVSSRPFPEAAGAKMILDGPSSPWMASSQGIGMLCAQRPFPLLALSEDPSVLQELSTYLRVS
jgi:hypothetical protein